MIKKIAWDAFKNTGDINSFLEFKQIEDLEKNIGLQDNNKGWKVEEDGKYKNEWSNISRK